MLLQQLVQNKKKPINIGRNVVHGSDGPETAAFEIALWFQPTEINDWSPSDQIWRVES